MATLGVSRSTVFCCQEVSWYGRVPGILEAKEGRKKVRKEGRKGEWRRE